MVITKKYIKLQTDPPSCPQGVGIVDITPQVEQQLADANIDNGIVNIFVTGSTAGLVVCTGAG